MSQFSYSFCICLFHSLWQAALLLVLYTTIHPFIKKQLPSYKRNVLFILLLTQAIMSVITFLLYYNNAFDFYRNIVAPGFPLFSFRYTFPERIAPWIIFGYSLIISFKAIFLSYQWYRFRMRCNATLSKPSIDLKLFTIKKTYEFGISRKVTLWFSSSISTPLTYGFLKPVILMPVALINHLSMAEAESLIIHEITHIKNNDFLLNWLLVISQTLFFFNPFIKIISNKIKLEREKNCDVQVLHFQYPVLTYAETLLKTASFKSNINLFPIAAVFKNKQLLERIRFFTAGNNLVFNKKKYKTLSFSATAIALFLNIFIIVQISHNKGIENSGLMVPKVIEQGKFFAATETASELPAATVMHTVAAPGNNLAISAIPAVPLKNIKSIIKPLTEKIQPFPTEEFNINYPVPVVNIQLEEKEITVREEISGSNVAVTKAYRLKLKNGEWKDQLLYIMKEAKPRNDSICNSKDSLISYVPPMQ